MRSPDMPVLRASAATTSASGLRHQSGWVAKSISPSPSSKASGETPNGSANRSSQDASASSGSGATRVGSDRGVRSAASKNSTS